MRDGRAFLGETTDRARAFPGLGALDLSIEQDRWGQHTRDGRPRIDRFTLDNVPKHLSCANPRCQQGGLDLQRIALFSPNGQQDLSCAGHEGSPAGRRVGGPCDNVYHLTIVKAEVER